MFGSLVPVSDVTWQVSTHPVLLSHSSLALFINHCLEIFSARVPTVIHFYPHVHRFKTLSLRVC